jgi:Family of unknown function (DUF6194)
MDAIHLDRHLRETFDGVGVVEHLGDSFYFYDPDDLPANRMFPFATIVVDDKHDSASRLSEPGAYRLNIGLTKATYTARFGAAPTRRDENGVLETGFDYTVRDRLMPHPVYASQYWVCVVNPGAATFEEVRPLLAEAHEFAVRKHTNKTARSR